MQRLQTFVAFYVLTL